MLSRVCNPKTKQVRKKEMCHYQPSPCNLNQLFYNLLFCNIFAHFGVRLDVFHLIVVHDTEIAAAECLCHCKRNFRFCFDNTCPCPGV